MLFSKFVCTGFENATRGSGCEPLRGAPWSCRGEAPPPGPRMEDMQTRAGTGDGAREPAMAMTLSSPAFTHEGVIPARHACDGADLSPPLVFSGVPAGTASLALVCDDPDAPGGVWDHFLLYNLSPATPGLPEGLPEAARHPDGSLSGRNSWGRYGYGGPCPPRGVHRYYFTLYALGAMLDLPPGATKAEVLRAAKGHILASATLMGRYGRR